MTRAILAAAISAAVLALPLSASASDEANIKYRRGIMQSMAGHAGDIALLTKGAVTHAGHLKVHTRGLADLAILIGDAFKAKTADSDKTKAKQKVWEDWGGFETKAQALEKATSALADAAATGGDPTALGPKLKAVFDACKSCHQDFRKPLR